MKPILVFIFCLAFNWQHSFAKKQQSPRYKILGTRANVFQLKGNLIKASFYYIKALSLAKAMDDLESQAIYNNNLGVLFYRLGYLDSSQNRLKIAETSFVNLDYNKGLAACFLNQARLFLKRGNIQAASDLTTKAEGLITDKNKLMNASVLLLKSKLALLAGNLNDADQHCSNASAKYQSAKNKRGQIVCDLQKAIILSKNDDWKGSADILDKALLDSKLLQDRYLIYRCLSGHIANSEAMGDSEKISEYKNRIIPFYGTLGIKRNN